MTDKLKPCPFCGGEADLSNTAVKLGDNSIWSVECLNCGVIISEKDKEQVVEMWNRRAGEQE